MRVIKQNKYADLEILNTLSSNLSITQEDIDVVYGEIRLDTQGAKQLIEVLKEFINDSNVS